MQPLNLSQLNTILDVAVADSAGSTSTNLRGPLSGSTVSKLVPYSDTFTSLCFSFEENLKGICTTSFQSLYVLSSSWWEIVISWFSSLLNFSPWSWYGDFILLDYLLSLISLLIMSPVASVEWRGSPEASRESSPLYLLLILGWLLTCSRWCILRDSRSLISLPMRASMSFSFFARSYGRTAGANNSSSIPPKCWHWCLRWSVIQPQVFLPQMKGFTLHPSSKQISVASYVPSALAQRYRRL